MEKLTIKSFFEWYEKASKTPREALGVTARDVAEYVEFANPFYSDNKGLSAWKALRVAYELRPELFDGDERQAEAVRRLKAYEQCAEQMHRVAHALGEAGYCPYASTDSTKVLLDSDAVARSVESVVRRAKAYEPYFKQMQTLSEYVFHKDPSKALDDNGNLDAKVVVQRAIELAAKNEVDQIKKGDPSGSEFSFWLLWNPRGNKPPHYKHDDFGSAKQEAIRLATENEGRGCTFYVLQAVTKVTFEGLKVERLDTDEIPF